MTYDTKTKGANNLKNSFRKRIFKKVVTFIFVFAMMTGVVVSYYMEYLSSKKEETISLFLEKLENLPKLSKK